MILFTLTVVITHNLLLALHIICFSSFSFILCYDVKNSLQFDRVVFGEIGRLSALKKCLSLVKESFPLFKWFFDYLYL